MATSNIILERNTNLQKNDNCTIQSLNMDENKNDNSNTSSDIIASSSNILLKFQNQQQQQPNDDKLPLKNAWGTYFYKADKQRDWKQNVIYITSISYVEDFWSFYTHTYGLRDLSNGSDYMFFKVIYTKYMMKSYFGLL
jgi:hypothetical protein